MRHINKGARPYFPWIFIVLILSVIGIAGIVLIYAQNQGEKSPKDSEISHFKARSAPDFELKDAKQHPFRLQEFRGTTLVVHFWASWCAPCLQEIPEWVALAQSFKGRPVKWIAIHLDKSWEDATHVLPTDKLSENVISLWDSTGKVADQFGTFQFPETYLISSDQKIVMKWVGPQDWSSPGHREFIEKALGE